MAVQGDRLLKTYKAAADIGTSYVCVYQSADNQVTRCAGTSNIIVGVCENNPLSGEPARVCFSGMTKVRAGTAITRGVELASSSGLIGKGGYVFPGAATDECLGYAESAGSEGELIEVRVAPFTHGS